MTSSLPSAVRPDLNLDGDAPLRNNAGDRLLEADAIAILHANIKGVGTLVGALVAYVHAVSYVDTISTFLHRKYMTLKQLLFLIVQTINIFYIAST